MRLIANRTLGNHQGRYDEAEAEYGDLLANQTRVLGAEHPHTLITSNNLTTMLNRQGAPRGLA